MRDAGTLKRDSGNGWLVKIFEMLKVSKCYEQLEVRESEKSKVTCPARVTGDYEDIKLENTGGGIDLQWREEMMAC